MRTPALAAALLAACLSVSAAARPKANIIGINVVLNREISNAIVGELGLFGKVRDVVYPIRALTIQAPADKLAAIQRLPYVAAAAPDADRDGAPVDTVEATDFTGGRSTWDLDAINVTDPGVGRTVAYSGAGVYVAVLDTGLLDSWRSYFPQERIAVEYAKVFGGGGGDQGAVSEPTNKWEHDQNSHGTHVTSTILGYSLRGTPINGVAPMATVIPVKVLNQNGHGWSSVIARGIAYVAELKAGPLSESPVVINMSLGGPGLDPMEKAAIDYAISQGVIIVASAGNSGAAGMGYPGAYPPVISVAAAGWTREWEPSLGPTWWITGDVTDPTSASDYYITDFSSRALAGQDLDVAAPGSWIVGPYQKNSGHLSYFFLGGTSMASPHVAGIVALMAQKKPALSAVEAESVLETTATYLPPGSATVDSVVYTWGSNATGFGLATANAALNALP